jgi:hypothetical protein
VQQITLQGTNFIDRYKELFTHEEVSLKENASLTLKPWEYKVWVK